MQQPEVPTHRAEERVLATLNVDGSRYWVSPRVSAGRFWHARRIVAYVLIAIFALMPYIRINGKPAMLFDILHRRFTLFGTTFFPTDTVLMALLMLIIFLGIFLVTALLGRVWCGWACPQTVYMEFLYRPIERLIEGAPGSRRAKKGASAGLRVIKYAVYLVCSCFLAHIFLAYFVGLEQLQVWVARSPAEHPTGFIVMATTTALMFFDFAYFREQTCLVACPYGRFQSALTDRDTMIISYDGTRGEPRGKRAASGRGDCIDCRMCVATCPTGIDIRRGLQMECIGCAQCIDACDAVMDKIKRPRGLIGYSSANILEGKAEHIIRPRIFLYPVILMGLIGLFVYRLATLPAAEAAVLPRQGAPFYSLPSGDIANQLRLRLVNRDEAATDFTFSLPEEAVSRGVRLVAEKEAVSVEPTDSVTVGCVLGAPPGIFSGRGAFETEVIVSASSGFTTRLPYRMLGPVPRLPKPETSGGSTP